MELQKSAEAIVDECLARRRAELVLTAGRSRVREVK
jgi:hypothetical protein